MASTDEDSSMWNSAAKDDAKSPEKEVKNRLKSSETEEKSIETIRIEKRVSECACVCSAADRKLI